MILKPIPVLCKKIKANYFLSVIRNFNSITAHGYAKLSLLKAYITPHKMDIIYLLEAYLDSSIQSGNDNLEIPGYKLVRSDHPSVNKRGGVYIHRYLFPAGMHNF